MLAIPPPLIQNPPQRQNTLKNSCCFQEVKSSLQLKILMPLAIVIIVGLFILFALEASYDKTTVKLGKKLFPLCPISLCLFGTILLVVLLWGKVCKKMCGNYQPVPQNEPIILEHIGSTDSGLSGDLNPPTPEMSRASLNNSRDSGISIITTD